MENVFDEMTITTEENERWKVTDLKNGLELSGFIPLNSD